MADPYTEQAVRDERAAVLQEKTRRQSLIHEAFPSQGTPKKASEGSQSNAPYTMIEPYFGEIANAPTGSSTDRYNAPTDQGMGYRK
jgi:hypothetical protein